MNSAVTCNTINTPDENLRALAEAAAGSVGPMVVLADRGDRRTVRLALSDRPPVIAKLWNLSRPRARIRQLLRRTKARAEWDVGRAMAAAGIPVSVPLAYFQLDRGHFPYHECVLLENLHDAESAATALHRAIDTRDLTCSDRITAGVLDVTLRCLEAGLIDRDLRLGNFLIASTGIVYRIDFENAVVRQRAHSPSELGKMLGALIATYAWMARPQAGSADDFAEQLLKMCRADSRSRQLTLANAEREIKWLEARTGVHVPWRSRAILAP